MEINVTHLVDGHLDLSLDLCQFSDSVFNSGLQDIGEITWKNACEYAAYNPLCSVEQLPELRDWISDFGAWDTKDITGMTDTELNALLLQFVSGDIRETEHYSGDTEFDQLTAYLADEDNTGRLYGEVGGQWFFYVGC